MNHRSLIFDLFGGYARYRGGVISLQSLAAVAEPFDVSTDALRVVMSRLRREGWVTVERIDGRAVYQATTKMWTLLDEGYERIFRPARGDWDGRWFVAIYEVPESDRSVRDQLRRHLAWLGFGPLVTSTWVSCHDRLAAVREWVDQHPPARVETLIARSEGEQQDRRFVGQCWDLSGLAGDYSRFVQEHDSRTARRRYEHAAGADALVARVRLVHEYRLFAFRDPSLPRHLLPRAWPGERAETVFSTAYEHLASEADNAFAALADTAR